MKTIKLFNDYGTYPIWIFNENGDLIDNDLPAELIDLEEAKYLRDLITHEYMKLFINNEYEFKYIGFKSQDDKNKFVNISCKFEDYLKEKVGGESILLLIICYLIYNKKIN